MNKKSNVKWSSVSKRKRRYPLINDLLRIMIQKWIIKNSFVVASPIVKDTILVQDQLTGKKTQGEVKSLIKISV